MSQQDADWYSRKSRELHEAANWAWDEAEARSREAGYPFKNRDGVMETPQGKRQPGTIDLALIRLRAGIVSGEIVWPPPTGMSQ